MIDQVIQGAEDPSAAGTEGGRRPTGVPAAAGTATAPDDGRTARNGSSPYPDPQVVEAPHRRKFSKAYKLDILKQVDACDAHGQIGAILRREGLYASHLANWRRLLHQRLLNGPESGKVTAKRSAQNPCVPQLRRDNARLKARLQQAELIIEIQKKVSELLGIPLRTADSEGSD